MRLFIVICLAAVCAGCWEDEKVGTAAMVKREMRAGMEELKSNRAESLEVTIRGLRVRAKRLLEQGENAEARRIMNQIPELEHQAKALREEGRNERGEV